MLDRDGKPQAMLGWTLEEFEQLREQAEAQTRPDRPPRYTIESMTATGTAKPNLAELTVEFKIWTSDSEVRVPLRLDGAILRPGGVEHNGGGQGVLQSGENGEGYVLWLRGDPGQEHRVTLENVVAPLSTLGEETRLQLVLPRATSWGLELTVPVAGATAEVSDGATLLRPSPGEGNTTVFTVRGSGGGDAEGADFHDFQITWRKAPSHAHALRPVLEAAGVLLAKIDRRNVTTEATLTVQGHGGPFDRFRITLPKGAQLIPGNGAGYAVTVVSRAKAGDGETVVEVRRGRKSTDPMEEIRLTTRQSRAQASEGGWFELGGFEVIDAVRQSGYVGVKSDGDWRVRCDLGWGVRQIDELPDSLLGGEALEGSDYLLEYFGQPFSLAARVAEVKTRVYVEPEYHVHVEQSRVRLEGTLKYKIHGAKAFALKLELPGWQLDEVGPDAVVADDDLEDLKARADVDGAPEASDNRQGVDEAENAGGRADGERGRPSGRSRVVSVPLEQPTTGEVDVTIRAHQEIEPGTKSLRLALPRPQAESLSPALVAVWPADNVELTPNVEAMVGLEPTSEAGLAPQQVEALNRFREGGQDPLLYRGDAGAGMFASGFQVHEQEVAVDVISTVTLAEQKAEVRQTLAYAIAYEPLAELTIEVPGGLAGPNALEVVLGDESLTPVPLPDQIEGARSGRPIRHRIVLPGARIGRCEIQVRYGIEVDPLQPNTSVIYEVPLVMPVQTELSSNKLYVTAPQGVVVHCRDQHWRPEPPASGLPRRSGLALVADQRLDRVVLGAQHSDLASTVVERTWVQTCLIHGARRDRAVFRFTSDEPELQLVLPAGADPRTLSMFLGPEEIEDRARVRVQASSDEPLRIPLDRESRHRRQWLEVQYGFSDPRPEPGRLSLELPRLGGEAWVQRVYWELVLPQNEHVIVGPEQLARDYRWGWAGFFWGRKPLMGQAELEAWSGASRDMEVPKGTGRYLYGTLGSVARCELHTAARSLVVLAASAVVLVVGLVLIYVPACRHPAALLAVATVLVGAAVVYPGPSLLAAEAGSLGLVLVLLAGLLYRTLGPGRSGGLWREPSSSVLDRSSTQAQYFSPAAAKPPSTQTVPAGIPTPTSDPSP
jgi:hypothetical protein